MADDAAASACPVDHKAREAWLKAAQQNSQQQAQHPGVPPKPLQPKFTNSRLGTNREVSTIPRGFSNDTAAPPDTAHSPDKPVIGPPPVSPNAQTADPHTSQNGFWIYPSEEMFFNAMKRKQYNPAEKDMPSVIPIHNAVNERTWQEILRWEKNQGAFEKCGGPKLVSFKGDSTKITPRARFFNLMGYQLPFDRHDWVVDRCGTKVEYVIDFYQGKGQTSTPLSFFLDVRPKLNSWEGWRMRIAKTFGAD